MRTSAAASRFGDLSIEEVARRLATKWAGRPFEVHASLPSTNDAVFERAAAGAAPGLAIAADAQSAGRGRRGRTFDSRAGLGLWTSVLLRPPADPANAPRLSLIVALAAARAIDAECGTKSLLKWPNDVRAGGRKVAGILVEARTAGSSPIVVAGIGINVHHRPEDFPPDLRGAAGSLRAVARRAVDRSALAARLFAELEAALDAEDRGAVDLVREFRERDAFDGREVVVHTEAAAPIAGIAAGIEEDGRLRVRLEDGTVAAFRNGEASSRSA